ncbi:MAG TPA: DUF4157 domain-containing protein [Bryobacteraceae bacterium]
MLSRKTESAAPAKCAAASGALRIGEPDDSFEREADRAAEQVLAAGRMHWSLSGAGAGLRRKCDCGGSGQCAECKDKELERKAADGAVFASHAPPIVNEVLRSPGQPLDEGTRAFFEPRFGYDFSRVRVHTDAKAAESTRAVGATAYTVGRDVVFGVRQYAPGTSTGRRLMAHELAHVVQHSQEGRRGSCGPLNGSPEGNSGTIASKVTLNPPEPPAPGIPASQTLSRQADERPEIGPFQHRLEAQAEPEFEARPKCLNSFQVLGITRPIFRRISPAQCAFEGHFEVAAEFSKSCNCSDLEYRQFIRGHIHRERDGGVTDRGDLLGTLPEGRLTEAFQEDGDTSKTPVSYGHRDQPPSRHPEDHYLNQAGADDQRNGCRYKSADTPFAHFNCQDGEIWDVELDFHGDILQKGKPIQRRFWTPIRDRFVAPP